MEPNLAEYKFLGKDEHGFLYYEGPQQYVYQRYPTDRDCWERGQNLRGTMHGWVASGPAWERTLHKILVEEQPAQR